MRKTTVTSFEATTHRTQSGCGNVRSVRLWGGGIVVSFYSEHTPRVFDCTLQQHERIQRGHVGAGPR